MKLAMTLVGGIVLASCAPMGDTEPTIGTVKNSAEVRVAGEARRCLSLSSITRTRVRNTQTIDFETSRGEVYRNRLDVSCSGLNEFEGFAYNTPIGQICEGDSIIALESDGINTMRGPSCRVGPFVPVEYVEYVGDAPPIMGE
tara:strand:- start:164 stop:592 length:429 start_codon:yes stop_codon:yes gene_type:complete